MVLSGIALYEVIATLKYTHRLSRAAATQAAPCEYLLEGPVLLRGKCTLDTTHYH